MSDRFKKSIIVIALFLLLILLGGGAYWFVNYRKQVAEPVQQQIDNEQVIAQVDDTPVVGGDLPELVVDSNSFGAEDFSSNPAEASAISLKAIGLSFVERFGSFSSQSNYENINELRTFMTPKMQAWSDRYIAEQKASADPNAEFYGVTTYALSNEVLDFDEEAGRATLLINTQRIETRGANRSQTVSYKEITVELERVENVWYVDSATWQ